MRTIGWEWIKPLHNTSLSNGVPTYCGGSGTENRCITVLLGTAGHHLTMNLLLQVKAAKNWEKWKPRCLGWKKLHLHRLSAQHSTIGLILIISFKVTKITNTTKFAIGFRTVLCRENLSNLAAGYSIWIVSGLVIYIVKNVNQSFCCWLHSRIWPMYYEHLNMTILSTSFEKSHDFTF